MTIRVADHPRAARSVKRTRARSGLAGLLLGALLAHRAGLPGFDLLLRALLLGIGAHCAGWLLAVTYWRGAILAELEAVRRRREELARGQVDDVLRAAAAAGEPV